MKTAVVTGSSRGIGLAVAKKFLYEGYTVVVNGRNQDKLNEIKDSFRYDKKLYNNIISVAADISDYGEAERLFAAAGADVLVNNAGIAYNGLFQDMTAADWDRLININIKGMLNCSHFALPYMLKKKSGAVINISSIWGSRGASCEAVYSMTKGGVDAFTKSLAKELGPSGIRVNAIACGVIDTDMNAFLSGEEKDELIGQIPAGRFGTADEIADMAAFLASEKAGYINGQIITIDGGMI